MSKLYKNYNQTVKVFMIVVKTMRLIYIKIVYDFSVGESKIKLTLNVWKFQEFRVTSAPSISAEHLNFSLSAYKRHITFTTYNHVLYLKPFAKLMVKFSRLCSTMYQNMYPNSMELLLFYHHHIYSVNGMRLYSDFHRDPFTFRVSMLFLLLSAHTPLRHYFNLFTLFN